MGLQTKINIFSISMNNVVLVENIIQALVKVFQVEQNNSSSSFHANLDLVDVSTHLYTYNTHVWSGIRGGVQTVPCTYYNITLSPMTTDDHV